MTIQHLLQISDDEHEMIIMSNYMVWCKSYNASNDTVMQRLLAAPILFNWWYKEYTKLEADFIALVKPYASTMSKEDLTNMYRKEMIQMHKIYSKALIYTSKYKHQNITNHINN